MEHLIIEHIGRLVTMDENRRVIVDGAMHIRNGNVVWLGPQSDLSLPSDALHLKRWDATGRVVTPGLVDCHTHVVFGGDRRNEFAQRAAGVSYEMIAARGGGIRSTMHHTRAASEEDLLGSASRRLDEMRSRGVTCVEVKSGYGLDLASELKMLGVIDALRHQQPSRLEATFLGAHTRPPEFQSTEAYAEHVIQVMLPAIAQQGIARFCEVFCERNVFSVEVSRRILLATASYGLIPKVHAEQLSHQGGTALGVELNAASVDHLEWISDTDIQLLAGSDTVAVVLPGAGVMLNVPLDPTARRLVDAGGRLQSLPIAIQAHPCVWICR